MRTWYGRHDNIEAAGVGYGMGLQRRHSFPTPYETSSEGSCNIKCEDTLSSSSERTSAGSTMRLKSTTLSSIEDDSLFDPTKPSVTFVRELPTKAFVQSSGRQMLRPVIHGPHYQLSYNVTPEPIGVPSVGYAHNATPVPIGVPSVGYAPVTVQRMPMNIPLPQKLQHQRAVYSIQQCQPMSQFPACIPHLAATVPYMMAPVTFPQQNNLENQQMSMMTSKLDTPVLGCSGSPEIANIYKFINTPLISSASWTPITCPMTIHEVPPELNLDTKTWQDCVYPQRVSCSVNGVSAKIGSKKSEPVVTTCSNKRINKQEAPENSLYNEAEKFKKTEDVSEVDSLWKGNLDYKEYQFNGGSNLFVTWSGSKVELVEKLQSFNLEVREVLRTIDSNICNVIFQTHPIARKAFTMQKRIRLRIVPPKHSLRIWFRNPSPTFLVKFEIKCRLPVRRGKAECHDVVGELLKGCVITADQLKGSRIRVKCFEGSFKFPCGKVVGMKGVQKKSDKKTSIGWISYRCKNTNESFVIRRSWNKLADYLYTE